MSLGLSLARERRALGLTVDLHWIVDSTGPEGAAPCSQEGGVAAAVIPGQEGLDRPVENLGGKCRTKILEALHPNWGRLKGIS